MIPTDLSLWTPLLTKEARRQACVQHGGLCCNCGSTECSLHWFIAPFQNVFFLLNHEFAAHDPDSYVFETWKTRMCNWRRRDPQPRHQGNVRRNASGKGPSGPHNPEYRSVPQGISAGITPTPSAAAPPARPLTLSTAPALVLSAAPAMRYGPTYSANNNPNARQPGTIRI